MFALIALAVVGAATALIMYQHAQHTGMVLASVVNPATALGAAPGTASVSGTISANPINTGAASRASGQWTPLGPPGMSIFGYNPGQANQ
jgi:hypothetical protein